MIKKIQAKDLQVGMYIGFLLLFRVDAVVKFDNGNIAYRSGEGKTQEVNSRSEVKVRISK